MNNHIRILSVLLAALWLPHAVGEEMLPPEPATTATLEAAPSAESNKSEPVPAPPDAIAAPTPALAPTLAPAPTPPIKSNDVSPAPADPDEVRAEVVPLPALPLEPVPAKKAAPIAKTAPAAQTQLAQAQLPSALQPPEPGYKTVLSGTLYDGLFDLGPAESPILIRGNLVIADNATVKIKPGAVVHLRADPKAQKPARVDVPDPSQSAVIWVWGALRVEGHTGNPVEVANLEKVPASVLLYGSAHNKLDGMRLKNVSITQTAGVAQWTNCEMLNSPHYALAAGAALFTHCTFKTSGGVFATYNLGPWSLLMRKNVFDSCREGVVLGADPGETRLIVEKNHFLNTRGAHIRAMPVPPRTREQPDLEVLVGENWYGTNILEEAEMRLVDRRIDPTVRARLTTRPPAEQPYPLVGAGMPSTVIAGTLREQQVAMQKIVQVHSLPLRASNAPSGANAAPKSPTTPAATAAKPASTTPGLKKEDAAPKIASSAAAATTKKDEPAAMSRGVKKSAPK